MLVAVQVQQGVNETMGQERRQGLARKTLAQDRRAERNISAAITFRLPISRGEGQDIGRAGFAAVAAVERGHALRRNKNKRDAGIRCRLLEPLDATEECRPAHGCTLARGCLHDPELHAPYRPALRLLFAFVLVLVLLAFVLAFALTFVVFVFAVLVFVLRFTLLGSTVKLRANISRVVRESTDGLGP